MPVITWKVDDGYVNNGPHKVEIDQEDWDECETEEDRQYPIEDTVRYDFEDKVSYIIVEVEEQND